jgi:hypothetical protein
MCLTVIRSSDDLKIAPVVMRLITIAVVNDLIRCQIAPQFSFGYETMLQLPHTHGYLHVHIPIYILPSTPNRD